MNKEYSCGCLVYTIFNNEYKYLVIKQKNTNSYGFPKGHMEDDETKIETAIRETFEETGINVRIYEDEYSVVYYSPKVNVIKELTIYLAEAINTNVVIQEEEIISYHWLNYKDVLNILTYDTDKDIFTTLSKHI